MYLDKFFKLASAYQAPEFITEDLIYATIVGSRAYGAASTDADVDIYGVCIPPIEKVFPHLEGHIPGFGPPVKPWDQWQYQGGGYDITIYSLVKYFDLLTQGNPNIIETLFTADGLVVKESDWSTQLRKSRRVFLSKNIFHKFIGFSKSQRDKMFSATDPGPRKDRIEEFGYDTKAAYHSLRLLLELQHLLATQRMDLAAYGKLLRKVKRGDFNKQEIKKLLDYHFICVEEAMRITHLPEEPDEDEIRRMLVFFLEQYYAIDIPWLHK